MIGEFIAQLAKGSSWWPWQKARDDQSDYYAAARYVADAKKRYRQDAERVEAGMPTRERENDPTLRHAVNVIYRRVLNGPGEYRTMTKREFKGSRYESAASDYYTSIIRGGRRSASGMP